MYYWAEGSGESLLFIYVIGKESHGLPPFRNWFNYMVTYLYLHVHVLIHTGHHKKTFYKYAYLEAYI